MTHKRKNRPSLLVRVVATATFRLGETKRPCVIYTDSKGDHHVRTKPEFDSMFEAIN